MLEGYITPLLTSYLNKYIKNIKPSDLKLSFWGGDAVLTNLQLKLDAIEDSLRSLGLPFEVKSGSVKQLTLHIPWTAIGSEPIIASFDSVECTIKLHNFYQTRSLSSPRVFKEQATPTETTPSQCSPDPQQAGTAPGYISGLLNRITNNVRLRVTNCLLKIIEEHCDLQFSISIKEAEFMTANSSWQHEFIYTDHLASTSEEYYLHRVCLVTGATVCLDVIGGCGQVEEYDEPFLDGCGFECRWKIGYREKAIIENRFEILARDLEFSVSENQFVLFIHFLDWFMGLYYSMKKLRGRDDDVSFEKQKEETERKEEEDSDPALERESSASRVEDKEKREGGPSLEESGEAGWGSWLMSFVAPDESGKDDVQTTPLTPPSLSLGFYAKSIKIDFRVSTFKKQRPSVFLSQMRKGSWFRVMSLRFSGCMSHVDRIPSLKHLGASVGIMSVNGWMGGEGVEGCTCGLGAMAGKKHKKIRGNEEKMVHVYSLGSPTPIDVQPLLNHSLFDESLHPPPPPHHWLQYKPEYQGLWFTYDYYDSAPPERETETCQETLKLGKHSLILSLDVMHRLDFFIEKFRVSLEATPLVSQGLIVLGDPVAKTMLSITSDTTLVHLPLKSHISSCDSKPTTSLIINRIGAEVTMAMYSGNATPTDPQTLHMDCTIEEVTFSSVECSNDSISHITGLLVTDQSILCPQLLLSVHSKTDGSLQSSYYHLEAPEVKTDLTFRNLCLFFIIAASWLSSASSLHPPLPAPSERDATDRLILSLRDVTGEYSKSISEGTLVSCCLGEVLVHFISSSVSSTVPVIQSPAPIRSCIKSLADNTLHNIGSNVSSSLDERAFEVCLVWPREEGVPLLGLKVGGIAIYLPHNLLAQFEEYAKQLLEIWCVFKDEQEENKVIPAFTPIGHTTQPSHSFPSHLDSPVLSSYQEEEDEEGEETGKTRTAQLLSLLESYKLDISCEHILFMFSFEKLKTPLPATPLSCLPVSISDERQRMILFAFPRLKVETSYSSAPPHHHLLANIDQPSLKVSLTDGLISAIINTQVTHVLNPLSVNVSLALIQSPSVIGVVCIGIHADVKILQITIDKQKVKLLCQVLNVLQSFLCLYSPPPPPPPTHPLVSDVSFNKLPSSVASSSHSLPPPPPPPFSDVSSTSLMSLYGSNPSLWLQLTLGKLVVGISDSKTPSSTMYLAEADEISFSLDVQERISSYQLKLSSLEANSSSSSLQYSSSFTKLFSSSSSVVMTTVAKEIESQLGVVNGESNVSFPVSPLSPATLPSFLLLEIISPHKYESSSLPTKVKLHVQMFEGVLWLPLAGAILDIFEELSDNIHLGTGEKTETSSRLSITAHKQGTSLDNQWPSLDVKFNNFNIFTQSESASGSLLVLASEGLCVSSNLDFPVSRLIVSHSAMRRLEIAVHEKRCPPLLGYQLMVYSAQLIGIRREHDSTKLESCSLSYASDIRVLYSPSLRHHSKGQFLTDDKSVVATGHLLELHFDSKVFLFCGKDQVDCLLDVCNGITRLIQNRFNKHAQLATEPVKQEKETCPHYQILVTGKALSLKLFSLKQEIRKDLKEVEFSLLIFNPTLMVHSLEQSLNIDLSVFNVLASYHGNDKEACQVMETCEGSMNDKNGLRSGLLQVKINKQIDKGIILSCIMSRSLRVTVTPPLILLILNSIQTINNFTSQIKPEGEEVHVVMSDTKRAEPGRSSLELKSVSLSFVTKQVIIIIGGTGSFNSRGSGVVEGSGDDAKGSGDFAKGSNNDEFVLVWDSLSIAVPPNKTIESSSKAPFDAGSGNIDVIQAQISLEGIELFVFIDGHKSVIIPYCILTSLITYWIPLSLYDSGRLEYSLVSDWVQVILCMAHVLSANKLIEDYNMAFEEQLLRHQKNESNKFVELNKEREGNSMTQNDDSCLRDEIRSHDDLRSGSDLILITDSTDILIPPAPGEVRFYEGGTDSPPSMMWSYKESRRLCSISILPVPLTVMGEEDWPLDIKVVCELSYYSLMTNDWVCLDTLHLSEVSPAHLLLLSHKGMESSNKWRLTLPAIEWTDGDNDIHRLELPLTDLQTGGVTAVLSPLVLAGCTTVDSIIITTRDSFNVPLSITARIKSLESTLRRDPLTDIRNTRHSLSSNVDDFPLDLFQFKCKDLTIGATLVEGTRQMHVKLSGLVSLRYTDIRDLLWRDTLFPTALTINSITKPLKQFNRLKESKASVMVSGPTVIRVSPSLLYTLSMTTNTILLEQSHYATRRSPNDRKNDKQPLGAYVIHNKSLIDLVIGQMGTVEKVLLPRHSNCSYNWRSFNNEKKLHISYGSDVRWCNGFTIDAVGIHQLVMDDGLCLLVQVSCNGSIQKLVTISGELTISSRIQEPVLLLYNTALDSLHQSKFIDIGSRSRLEGVVWYDTLQSGLSFQFKEANQSRCPLFKISLDSDLSLIKAGEENGESYSFWSSVKSVADSPAVEVTLGPLFEICNHFPFQLQLLPSSGEGGGQGVGPVTTIPGGGSVTPLDSTMAAGRWYLMHLKSLEPVEGSSSSSLIKISTGLRNELPEFENECMGLRLYKECTCTDDRKKLEEPPSIVSIPTNKGVMKGYMFMSRRKEGTIRIEVVPQVVLINETTCSIKRKRNDGLILSLCCNELYPLSIDEELTLVVDGDDCDEFFTAELSFKDYQISGQPPKTKRLTLTSSDPKQELVYKILVSFVMHNNTLIIALKPIFTLFNQTRNCLSVYSSLEGATSNNISLYPLMSEGRKEEVSVPSSQSHSLLSWWSGVRADAKLQLTFVVYVTANTGQPSDWSIPLSLNFVRRSFSLPTPLGPSPCLLTTHSDGCGQYYIVISHDPRPRLICANHTRMTLQIMESGSIGIHSRPQTLSSGHESYFEPPSLAKLYPTTTNTHNNDNNSESDGDDENVVFKTLSDIHIRIGSLISTGPNASDPIQWTDPIPLHYDTEKYLKLSDTKLVFSTSYQYGTLYISLLPGDGGTLPVPIQTLSHCLISKETLHLLDIECFLEQLTLSIDVDEALKIRPVFTCVFDSWSSKLSVSHGSQYQCSISIKSIQIDHHTSTNELIVFPVLALPRHDHVPPLSIVERELPPFLSFSVNWTKFSDNVGGTFITETCLSLQPVTLQFDDSFVRSLKKITASYSYSPLPITDTPSSPVHDVNQHKVPGYILEEANRDRYPLAINHLQIDGVIIYLSLCFTRGLSLSVDESRILLSPLSHRHLYFNWSELAQSLASHYSLSLLSQLDWILGSLDIIGSPGTLINTLQSGLRDFLSLPYQGLTRGPGFFILGLGQGTRSLLTGLLGGALRSVTNFASGMALNVERLSLDEDHVSYQEDLRRRGQRSLENPGAGLMVGVSSFGMSVMSAVAGLVEQPLHSIIERQEQEDTVATHGYTRSIVTGVGKGILGVVTKPVGGALQLVSQTGRGIIGITGLKSTPVKRERSVGEIETITCQASLCRHLIVLLDVIPDSVSQPFTIFHGSFKSLNQDYQSSMFYLTTHSLYVIDTNNSTLLHKFNITDYHCITKKESEEQDEVVIILTPVYSSSYSNEIFERMPSPSDQTKLPGNCSPPPSNKAAGVVLNELHLRRLEVEVFISLFKSARKTLQEPQEYFII